jgi:CubicO group peptidase (beta-lactamase class C family)
MLRVLFVLLATAVASVAQDRTRMDKVAKAQAAGDRFMGSVLVAKDGAIVFEHSYGWANLEWKVPNTASTKFRLGSVTKQFTAAAILLLEERGKLKLDDPVAKFIPEAPSAWGKVTLYHLLTHTSGIPDFSDFPDYATLKLSPIDPARALERLRDLPLGFTPGEKYSYNNTGYVVLGYVVERVSGQSYETFLRENILKPLKMNDSGYDSNSAVVPRRASGYAPGPGGLTNAPYIDMHVPLGSGGLYSTTEDLLRWTQGLFGGKVLSAASLSKMTTPNRDYYALGLVVHTVGGRKVIEHEGSIEGFNALLAYYPESRVTVVVLANVMGSGFAELASQLAAINFGDTVKLVSERKEIDVAPTILQRYVGVYQHESKETNTIRLVDGRLTTQLSGQAAFPIYPESPMKFFLKIVDAQVEFFTDDSGKVAYLVQYQGGETHKAARISDTVVERIAITVPRTILESYVGTYELKRGFDLAIFLEGDQLMSQATRQSKVQLFAEAETKFFLKVVDAQLEFGKDASGKVTYLVLHQGSVEVEALRKK